MATKYDEAVNYLIDYKEYDNEYVDNFTKPYEIDSGFKESVDTLQEAINDLELYKKAVEILIKQSMCNYTYDAWEKRILQLARKELESEKENGR